MAIVPEDTYQAEDQTPVKMDTSEPAVDMSQPEPDPLFSYSEAELQKLNAFQIEQQNVTPEAAKSALDQESNMGMPSDFNDPVTGTFSDLGKISVQSIQKDAPRFTSWLAENKHHLPLAADDLQTMKDMEFGIEELSTLDKLYNTAGSAFSGFNAMVAKTPAFLYNVAAAPQNFVADALNIPSLKANADLENSVSKYFGEQQKVFAEKLPELSQSAFAELSNGNFSKAARITLYQALQSAPTSIALGTASIAGTMATRVGLAAAGAMSGADKAQEYQESGMAPSKAAVMAIPSAIYEVGFESLAIGKITQGFAEQITKAMGSQTAKEWAKAVSKGLAYSFAQEASEESLTSIANDLTDNIIGVSNYSFGEIASRAVDAGLVGGVAGGAGVGVPIAMSGVYRSQAMRQAQLQKDFYMALSEKSERSALKARLPEKFQEAVASMTKDGPVENIYVNAEALQTYFQSKGEGKLAEFLNSIDANESYDAAIESGGLVKIPTSVWATKVAGTDVHKGMADDITFDPSKFTSNEAKQIEDVSPETMKLAEERLSSPDVAGSTPAQIQKMMEEVGIPKAVARQASQVWRHIDVLQTRTPNAKKLFDQISLTLTRNGKTSTKAGIQPEGSAPTPINQAINGPIEGYAYKKEAIENLSAAVMGIETDTSKLVGFAQQGDRAGSENIQRLAGYTIGEPFIMQVRNKYDRLDKKEIQKIVQKALDGKKLTVGQQAIFDELYRASGYDKEYSSNPQDVPLTEEDFMLQGGSIPDTININGVDRPTKNSEGKLIADSIDKIKNFYNWFGDSKVVDNQGRPLVSYHGAKRNFNEFSFSKLGESGTDLGAGWYWSNSIELGKEYAGKNGNLITGYLNLQNPIILDSSKKEKRVITKKQIKDLIKEAYKKDPDALSNFADVSNVDANKIINGIADIINNESNDIDIINSIAKDVYFRNYEDFFAALKTITKIDGIIKNFDSGMKHFVAYLPTQGKRIDNVGSFDPTNKNMLFQGAKQNDLGFYSKLVQTISEKMGTTATKAQVEGMIKDIKPEERKWLGIDDFLKGKEKINKAELIAFLEANDLQIKEIVNTDSSTQITIGKEEADAAIEAGKNVYREDGTGPIDETSGFPDDYRFRLQNSGQNNTKFGQYVLPNGTNYREVLFTLPERSAVSNIKVVKNDEGEFDVVGENGRVFFTGTDEQEAKDYIYELNIVRNKDLKTNKDNFQSSHFDEANILAHVRLNDRTDAEGKRVLFVEEIQSDWHQAGRKQGYKADKYEPVDTSNVTQAELKFTWWNVIIKDRDGKQHKVLVSQKDAGNVDEAKNTSLKRLNAELSEKFKADNKRRIPDAPFKKTWHEFALKRIIRMASEQGYDKIAWTTGDQQADRYDLAKQVDAVSVLKNEDGTYSADIYKNGDIVDGQQNIDEDKLESLFGKDLAKKIINQEGEKESSSNSLVYKGDNLKVGGEGMKGFYDKILVDAANKLGKKYGAKVVDGKIRQENAYYVSQDTEDAWGVYKRQGNSALGELIDGGYELKRDALLSFKKFDAESESVIHELEITPALKDAAINEGFSLFQGEQDAKGKITFDRAQKIFNIEWLKNADLTTFLHESAHLFLEINTYLANDPETSEEVKADYKKILDYVGLKEGEQLKTKHHEKFAEAFEKYLMTGKAPTVELRQAFATIKSWFISIYHSIKNLYPNVELNEEITGVFDRMLATDAEIERAKEDIAADPMIKEAISVMKPDEAARYLKALESEKKSAEELIYAEALKEYTREERAKRKARKKEIQEQVEAELKPQYRVFDSLTDGITMQDGSTVKMKLDRKEVEDVYGAEIAKKIPASVYGSNASGLDVVASTLIDPFASGAAVVKILSEQMPKQKAIKSMVNSMLDAEFGDPIADGTIGDLADAAVHNVDGAKRRLIELDFLIQNNPKEFKRQAGIMARRRLVTEAQFRRRAEITIGTMNLKEIKPSQFKRAEAKNGNEAFKAFQAGDYAAAIEFKQKELLNFELHRLSIMANDEVQKGLNKFNKFFASDEKLAKRRSIEYINAGRAILAKFGLGETERTPESYLEQIKKYDEEGYAVAKAQYDAIEIPSKKYTDLSFNEFVSIKDSVDALWDLSRADNQIMVEGKMISKAQALEEIMADYDKMSPVKTRKELGELTTKEKIEAAFLSAKQALVRIEAWADYMGPSFRKYIYEPISSAATNYRIARKDYAERVKKMVDAYAKTVDFDKAIATDLGGMDGTFKNKYELIGALLHTGNASNYKKLLLGNKWGTRNEDGSLNDQAFKSQLAKYFANGTITKTDMDFVQSIWDLLEEMKPEAQKAHKAMYGYYFSEITANEIVTPFGAYKGGYYPAVIDRNRTSSAAQEKKVFDASAELQSQSQMFPQTNNGFTKNRVENFSDKLQMNLMLAASHIDRVLKFTHMSPAVKDVQKILMSRDFKARLRNDDPEFFGNALLPWIQRSSLQVVSTPPNSLLEKIMAGARTRAAAQIMLLNVGNTLQQYTGIVVGMSKVKAKYIRQSMGSLLTKKTELYESIQKLSPFMVTRMDSQMETMSQAIDKILDPKNKFEQVRDFAVQNTYVLQSAAQNQVDAIIWMGAYNQALDKGLTSAQAVKDADSIVRLTQGSFSPEDVAKFEAGSPALRMFTLFGGYWNMVLNLAGTEGMKTLKESGLKSGAGRLTYLYMTIFLVPAVISGIIARAMWGAPFDEDDDGDIADDLLFNAMGDQFKTILSLVPIAGPTAISAYNRLFTENPFDDRLNLSPVLVALESVAGFPKAAYKLAVEDEIKRKDVKDVLTAVSMFTGVPVTPIAKPINYLLDVDSGKANPENPLDFTRGLVSGSAGGKQ